MLEWSWVHEQWTGSDRPFLAVRADVDAELAHGAASAVVARREAAAARHPTDAVAVYAWAYAAWRSSDGLPTWRRDGSMQAVWAALFRPASPRSREYARMRFLVGSLGAMGLSVRPLGDRMLATGPADHEVAVRLIYCLFPGRTHGDKTRGVRLAAELARTPGWQLPGKLALGEVYWRAWMTTHSYADADAATKALKTYLRDAPPDAPEREHAENALKTVLDLRDKMAARGPAKGAVRD